MKKIILLAGIGFAGFFFNACDYVNNVADTQQLTLGTRKVLIEDYTGHKCGNCPAAADELHRIDSIYGERIIPIAVHAGGFAATNPIYPTDFRTPEGDVYDNTFGISTAGNPNGLVSRKGFGGDFISGWTTWEAKAVPLIAQAAYFRIKIKNTYNPGTKQVTTAITVGADRNVSGKFNLSVLIVEDSIVAEQLDYRLPSGQQTKTDYLFMHVLRGSVNSTWGEQIVNGGWSTTDSLIKTYPNFQIGTNMIPEHCKIIAFVYNADNTSPAYYEVMQVEQAPVTPE